MLLGDTRFLSSERPWCSCCCVMMMMMIVVTVEVMVIAILLLLLRGVWYYWSVVGDGGWGGCSCRLGRSDR